MSWGTNLNGIVSKGHLVTLGGRAQSLISLCAMSLLGLQPQPLVSQLWRQESGICLLAETSINCSFEIVAIMTQSLLRS